MIEGPLTGERVDVGFTGMAHGGEAVGRAADGRVVFASGALPGESAQVELTEVHDRFARGRLAVTPTVLSPMRATPPCPHFRAWPERGLESNGACGACQWQHMTYEAQLQFKAAVLRDTLSRIGQVKDPRVEEPWGMADPWRYRNHARMVAHGNSLAYYAADGRTLVNVDQCPIAHPLVESLMLLTWEGLEPGTEVSLRAGTRTGDRMIVLHEGPDDLEGLEIETDASVAILDVDGSCHNVAGEPFLRERLGGHTFVVPPDAFFQVNTEMADRLVEAVRDALGSKVGRLVDIHSGVGCFAVLCADLADEVVAIERHPASVAAAVENAAGMDHITLLEAEASEGLAFVGVGIDAVIVDPPRAGIDKATVRLLAELAPPTIVYVSCEPATLARDVRLLVGHGWSLENCRPVDMFPQTFHIESVAVLRR